jgi:hypothetical protein
MAVTPQQGATAESRIVNITTTIANLMDIPPLELPRLPSMSVSREAGDAFPFGAITRKTDGKRLTRKEYS